MIQCPNCGAQNPDYVRECEFCSTALKRSELSADAVELRDLLLGMSLGVEDFSTICFALDIDWHDYTGMADEAGKVEMLVRQLEDQGRVDEVQRFLRDFRFPQSYAPLAQPPTDNLWLTYVYTCQNVTKMDQLQTLVEQIGMSDATQLPGSALPHKIREAIWVARRTNALPNVHEWLETLEPREGLERPRIRQRRSRTRQRRSSD